MIMHITAIVLIAASGVLAEWSVRNNKPKLISYAVISGAWGIVTGVASVM